MFPVFVFLLAATFAGCGKIEESQSPPASPPVPIENWPATRQTDRGNFAVTLQPSDGAIERGRHFSLKVQLEPDRAIDAQTSIRVDADMPAHRHGMNTEPEVIRIDENHYRVDGMLVHMAGDWVITVEISGESGPDRASFPVHIE